MSDCSNLKYKTTEDYNGMFPKQFYYCEKQKKIIKPCACIGCKFLEVEEDIDDISTRI